MHSCWQLLHCCIGKENSRAGCWACSAAEARWAQGCLV
jgi:hypothetical protein